MAGLKDMWRGGLIVLMLMGLAACDAGPSAVIHDGDGKAPVVVAQQSQTLAPTVDDNSRSEASMAPVDAPVDAPALEGNHTRAAHYGTPLTLAKGERAIITQTRYGDWPLWSSNRKYSADENAHYHFEKHGPEFGATSFEGYMTSVHGFIHSPPPGTQTIRRNNGDTLFYDPKGNVFAVMTKTGAPRTLFRPDDGAAYWDKQKQIESERRTARRDSEN